MKKKFFKVFNISDEFLLLLAKIWIGIKKKIVNKSGLVDIVSFSLAHILIEVITVNCDKFPGQMV